MTDETTNPIDPADAAPIRTRPRHHETVCLAGRTKWRLDALCLLGRRSRSATIELLIEHFLRGQPALRNAVDERAADPRPIRLSGRSKETV
jgi:hypothetical protein